MVTYVGLVFLVLAGLCSVWVLYRESKYKDKMDAATRRFVPAILAGACYLIGCFLLMEHHYKYLYIVNTVAATKYIISLLGGQLWGKLYDDKKEQQQVACSSCPEKK
jgi:hypothetical protein